MEKLIVISAPSGAGKTSIIHDILKKREDISFSVSACSREKRDQENNGKDYYFLGLKQFQQKINEGAFLEWEEVYENQYYGTLRSEIKKIWSEGKTVLFDVDVVGGLNIKNQYPKECLAIFIMPPSIKSLRDRLENRGSESEQNLEVRLAKAEKEISRNTEFDIVVLNDDFEIACKEVENAISRFIKS